MDVIIYWLEKKKFCAPPGQITSQSRFNDGEWHTVSWRRIHSYLLVSFDDAALYLRANMNPFDPRFNQTLHLYLGARPFKPGERQLLMCGCCYRLWSWWTGWLDGFVRWSEFGNSSQMRTATYLYIYLFIHYFVNTFYCWSVCQLRVHTSLV